MLDLLFLGRAGGRAGGLDPMACLLLSAGAVLDQESLAQWAGLKELWDCWTGGGEQFLLWYLLRSRNPLAVAMAAAQGLEREAERVRNSAPAKAASLSELAARLRKLAPELLKALSPPAPGADPGGRPWAVIDSALQSAEAAGEAWGGAQDVDSTASPLALALEMHWMEVFAEPVVQLMPVDAGWAWQHVVFAFYLGGQVVDEAQEWAQLYRYSLTGYLSDGFNAVEGACWGLLVAASGVQIALWAEPEGEQSSDLATARAFLVNTAAILVWARLLQFLVPMHERLGSLLMTLRRMFTEVFHFAILGLVLLTGVSFALYGMFRYRLEELSSFPHVMLQLFLSFLGETMFDIYDAETSTGYAVYGYIISLLYTVVATVVLANFLIALISDRFKSEELEAQSQLQHAKLVVRFRRMVEQDSLGAPFSLPMMLLTWLLPSRTATTPAQAMRGGVAPVGRAALPYLIFALCVSPVCMAALAPVMLVGMFTFWPEALLSRRSRPAVDMTDRLRNELPATDASPPERRPLMYALYAFSRLLWLAMEKSQALPRPRFLPQPSLRLSRPRLADLDRAGLTPAKVVCLVLMAVVVVLVFGIPPFLAVFGFLIAFTLVFAVSLALKIWAEVTAQQALAVLRGWRFKDAAQVPQPSEPQPQQSEPHSKHQPEPQPSPLWSRKTLEDALVKAGFDKGVMDAATQALMDFERTWAPAPPPEGKAAAPPSSHVSAPTTPSEFTAIDVRAGVPAAGGSVRPNASRAALEAAGDAGGRPSGGEEADEAGRQRDSASSMAPSGPARPPVGGG
ncbi:hypothetical protein HYH03_016866 [Edaphochlamys debaryana]|uniref:Ion transport domain-containing protein n=1 Tax=Edaphochlamys debaryana TaxID=47281 RepID=A0A835XQK5_9CHLO|nr:hypothetical protein HYH03_016866 [Edaphochlamys debaryana]|eukprot:KAG2484324.1 hypothetical protein HYH03_016866 [Edaphochlamys debaryana]